VTLGAASARAATAPRAFGAAVCAFLILGGCSGSGNPTYTRGKVSLGPCPRSPLRPRRPARIAFTIVNLSQRRVWPATYVLLSLQGAAKGSLSIEAHRTKYLGGGIQRATSPLPPGGRLAGSVNVYLDRNAHGTVTVGAWGAPSNSVAVPSSYSSPSCTLRP
jgi:hypothetical protein